MLANADGTKYCPSCSSTKNVEEFNKSSDRRDGRKVYCRECHNTKHRAYRAIPKNARKERIYNTSEQQAAIKRQCNLKTHYGITIHEYERMLKEQGGVCCVCKALPSSTKKKMHVDHCHRTGRIRGILCSRCNVAIGMCREDIHIIEAMAQYLKTHALSLQAAA